MDVQRNNYRREEGAKEKMIIFVHHNLKHLIVNKAVTKRGGCFFMSIKKKNKNNYRKTCMIKRKCVYLHHNNKTIEIMKTIYEQIAELIRIELLKRGFIVDVICTPTKDNSFKVKTTSFQTTPVLFKNVWIEDWSVSCEEKTNDKGDKYFEYYVSLYAFYERFDEGKNGCPVLYITFRKFEDWDRVRIVSIN